MATETFGWQPDIDSERSDEPKVKQLKFGDGYEARIPIGINTQPISWSVKFTRSRTEAFQILDFLKARGGSEKFIWTDPFGLTAMWVCRKWNSRSGKGVVTVSGTFEQVFEY